MKGGDGESVVLVSCSLMSGMVVSPISKFASYKSSLFGFII